MMEADTQRWKTAIGFMVAALVAWAILGSAGGDNSKEAENLIARERARFEDGDGNRIYMVGFERGASTGAIRRNAAGLRYSEGKSTVAYFYPEDAMPPVDAVKRAPSWGAAWYVLHHSPQAADWSYVFIRHPNREQSFADCTTDVANALCRG
jgi:hypothetical protein